MQIVNFSVAELRNKQEFGMQWMKLLWLVKTEKKKKQFVRNPSLLLFAEKVPFRLLSPSKFFGSDRQKSIYTLPVQQSSRRAQETKKVVGFYCDCDVKVWNHHLKQNWTWVKTYFF